MSTSASRRTARGSRASVVAGAKVNLVLRVLARESSGYHSIETIFQRLALGDHVRVCVTGSGRALDCAGPMLPPGGLGAAEHNLAYRAGVAYAEAVGWPNGFAIEIEKLIPVGGGLGGGSADAGAVLRALDALSPVPLGARLPELAAALGADVPFLATECPLALAWGRGERMLALRPLPPCAVTIVVPGFSVATAEAYGWLAAERGGYQPRARLLDGGSLGDWTGIAAVAENDFEKVVASRHPEVGHYVRSLREAGASVAMMSGSGSTVFGVFEPTAEEREAPGLAGVRTVGTRTVDAVSPVAIED